MRPGSEIAVFDGSGTEWPAVLETVSGGSVTARLGEARYPATEPDVTVTVCQAMFKPDLFEFVLQKCTELGAYAFVPLLTARVQGVDGAMPSETRMTRWRKIIQEAAEQSGRVRVPELTAPRTLADIVREQVSRGPVIVLWEVQERRTLKSVLNILAATKTVEHIALVIGPAGGLELSEVVAAEQAGAIVAGMGRRVLRAETAAIAAIAATLYEFGEMG